jgi:hypothetical protein
MVGAVIGYGFYIFYIQPSMPLAFIGLLIALLLPFSPAFL